MDKVEGHCLIQDRLDQLHMGQRNRDSLLSAALICYLKGPTMKFHIRGERRKKFQRVRPSGDPRKPLACCVCSSTILLFLITINNLLHRRPH